MGIIIPAEVACTCPARSAVTSPYSGELVLTAGAWRPSGSRDWDAFYAWDGVARLVDRDTGASVTVPGAVGHLITHEDGSRYAKPDHFHVDPHGRRPTIHPPLQHQPPCEHDPHAGRDRGQSTKSSSAHGTHCGSRAEARQIERELSGSSSRSPSA